MLSIPRPATWRTWLEYSSKLRSTAAYMTNRSKSTVWDLITGYVGLSERTEVYAVVLLVKKNKDKKCIGIFFTCYC